MDPLYMLASMFISWSVVECICMKGDSTLLFSRIQRNRRLKSFSIILHVVLVSNMDR